MAKTPKISIITATEARDRVWFCPHCRHHNEFKTPRKHSCEKCGGTRYVYDRPEPAK